MHIFANPNNEPEMCAFTKLPRLQIVATIQAIIIVVVWIVGIVEIAGSWHKVVGVQVVES